MRKDEVQKLEAILERLGISKEPIMENMKPKRQKAPPRPRGTISVREAERKYGISRSKVSRLANSGKIGIVARTKNWLYLDENQLKNLLGAK